MNSVQLDLLMKSLTLIAKIIPHHKVRVKALERIVDVQRNLSDNREGEARSLRYCIKTAYDALENHNEST